MKRDKRDPKKQTLGGRCDNCQEIYFDEPLYRHKGDSFICKECVLRLKSEERARAEDDSEEFDDLSDGDIIEVNEEDL